MIRTARAVVCYTAVFSVVTQSSSPPRACLHEGGGPQVGEVTCGGLPHLSCKRDHIKMRYYMDRRVTPPKRVTSSIWDTTPPCKQALRDLKKPNNSGINGKLHCLWPSISVYQHSKKIKIELKAKLRPDRPGLAIEAPTWSAEIGSWLS